MAATLLGVPLCGTLFMPLTLGVATLVFFWIFVFSKKSSLQRNVTSEVLQKAGVPAVDLTHQTKEKVKGKKKKSCGDSGSCCSKKKGKAGGCGSQTKAIETAKIFVDGYSNHCQEFAGLLSKQLGDIGLTAEVIPVSDAQMTELQRHSDGSLCVFLIDVSIVNNQRHWLQEALSSLKIAEKPLAGMKFSVFLFQPSPLDKTKVETVDQLLHKSGAVRVCKAETADHESGYSSSYLDGWAKDLCGQVEKWNEPKRKGCKCSPKKTRKNSLNGDLEETCSSSSACSDSEDDGGLNGAPQPILDLEDIGKLL